MIQEHKEEFIYVIVSKKHNRLMGVGESFTTGPTLIFDTAEEVAICKRRLEIEDPSLDLQVITAPNDENAQKAREAIAQKLRS